MEIPNGFAHAALVFDLANDAGELICTLGVEHTATDEAGVEDVANDIFAAWDADMAPVTSNEVTLLRVDIQARSSAGTLFSGTSSTVPKVGEAAFGAAPGVLAAILRKRTGRAGRQFRGRMFHPGLVGDADITNGSTITTGRQTELNAAAADFLNTLDGLAHRMFLLHTAPATPPTLVTALPVSPQIGTIRRRRD